MSYNYIIPKGTLCRHINVYGNSSTLKNGELCKVIETHRNLSYHKVELINSSGTLWWIPNDELVVIRSFNRLKIL